MKELKKFIVEMEDTLSCGLQTKNVCKDLEEKEEKAIKELIE